MPFQKGNQYGKLHKGHPYYPTSLEGLIQRGAKISAAKKGKPLTEKQRASLSRYWESKKGKSPSIENRLKVSAAMKGKKKSAEHVAKVAAALRGKKRPQWSGTNHHAWKGDFATYSSLHNWVYRHLGNKKHCENCGISDEYKTYHWANKSGDYKRQEDDWLRLCVPCHSSYDKGRNSIRHNYDHIGNSYKRKVCTTH
jgi:hypothetical protein